ncbi:glycosyltransferase [Streptomyces sp. NPDC015130]|uniref:glycosyltransferase family 4 protein n=1 Tax=Streptomyces sp. NPDC015130 TaxID=3364940 RepID=UPI0036F86DD2
MRSARSVVLVAVSGPDGAGTSALVRRLATLLRERSVPVVTAPCHGCFLCRRFPVPPRVRDTGEPGERWARRASDPERRGSLVRRAHASLDAAESAVRITAALLTAAARAHGRQAVVLTDRGPLDGLATFDPPASSVGARAFRRIAERYGLTLLVETGPETPPGHGRREFPNPPAARWYRYRSWSVRLPRVARLDGGRAPSLIAATALEQVLDTVRERAANGGETEEEETDGGPSGGTRSATEHRGPRSAGTGLGGPRGCLAGQAGPGSGAEGRDPGPVRETPPRSGGTERGGEVPPHVVVSVYDDVGDRDRPSDGDSLVVGRVARRLAEDFRVTVVTAGRRAGTEYRDGVRYVRLPVRRAGPRAGRLAFLALLPFVARRIRHDLWLESFTPPFSTGLLPLATRAPVVGIDRGRGADVPRRRAPVPFLLFERLGLRRYRHIVATSAADGSAIRRLSPRADVQVFAEGTEPGLLDESRLGSGQFILCLGRIDTWAKGLDLLLDAYDRARPPLDLLLAGSGTPAEERRLAVLVAAYGQGPDPRIHWVGYADEERKRQLLRDSAFLVLPSRHETFGRVALEGMAYGKPVLHFDVPALRWLRDGGGVAVPPFDVVAFGERMGELARDPALRRGLGRRSVLASQHYTWDETTGRYLALAHRLLDTPAAARRQRRGTSCRSTR